MSKIIRKIISTSLAPAAMGPYSQAVLVDKTLYISGQLGMDPTTLKLADSVPAQARKALENIANILKAAGGTTGNVVKTTVLLTDIGDFDAVNKVYAEFFGSRFPARACYQVSALPKGGRIEIEAVAVIGDIDDVAAEPRL